MSFRFAERRVIGRAIRVKRVYESLIRQDEAERGSLRLYLCDCETTRVMQRNFCRSVARESFKCEIAFPLSLSRVVRAIEVRLRYQTRNLT